MSDLEIHQNHVRGFGITGQVSESSESFIKLRTSFRNGYLRALKGAPLSVFICVALHEADSDGCSLSEIMEETGYTKPSVIDAIRYLSDSAHRFIEEAGLESDGTKRYRVTAFAWYGKKPQPSNNSSGKKILPPREKIFLPHDDDVLDSKPSEKIVHHDMAAVEKILEAVFEGVNVQRLAKILDAKRAQEWVDWIQSPETRKRFRNPAGAAYTALKESPNARPPQFAKPPEPAARRPVIRGKLAALYDNEDTADETE